ncbi:TIGR01548 family HAD-type hydrolase [Iningainema tapete]|uniref:TIGR01548 family HAD-type hydrolase n=1 Tax=Iningainema tapete BLCC-T55 TaxID=2748662 RepID=A0A8J7CAY2_9CYAN|nr:TIGR01548 family HAD-type hydrolase [Iningainema tapete]MBD2777691.1 TIGR01548 family HAD-type hydrolase [Iningainema tapete BLCC-T55]
MRAIVVFDIDGVVRDVSGSYRRAIADTVEHFTFLEYRPTSVEIDQLKSEGIWNNDWEASQELIYRYKENQTSREQLQLNYNSIVAFFQSRYRGTDPQNMTGYICDEPLLLQPSYLEELTLAGIPWGFFSGATRASANYVLEKRLGLKSPVLIAMEDAPSKPDPTGLFATVRLLESPPRPTRSQVPPGNAYTPAPPLEGIDKPPIVVYVGDTVADMYTVEKARQLEPKRTWIGVGVLPPHVQETAARRDAYAETLLKAGAAVVLSNVEELTIAKIQEW